MDTLQSTAFDANLPDDAVALKALVQQLLGKVTTLDPDLFLIDVPEACKMLGGSRPLHPATYYRGVAAGIYPKPIKIGNSARIPKREIVAVIKARIAARDHEAA